MQRSQPRFKLYLILVLLIIALLLAGCGRRSNEVGDVSTGDDAAATIAAQNAQLTLNAQAELLTQQAGSSQGGTGPQETEPQQPPIQQTQPPDTASLTITGLESTNCREGPLPDYKAVGALGKGQTSTVHGTNVNKDWWYIENPDNPGSYCWVWGVTTQVSGDTSGVQEVQPPLLATEPPPQATEPPAASTEPPASSACSPPYTWQQQGFSNPQVSWNGSGPNARLRVTSSAVIEPRCPNVQVEVKIVAEDDTGNSVFGGNAKPTTDQNGKATFKYQTNPIGTNKKAPRYVYVIWTIDKQQDVTIKADVPPVP